MGGYMSQELRCESVSMVQPENKTCFTSEHLFNTCADGVTAENISSYPAEQCTDSVDVNDDVAVNSKRLTTVDEKLLREPFLELIQLNSSTLNSCNSQPGTRKDNILTNTKFSTIIREAVENLSSNRDMENTRLVNKRQHLTDDSTNELPSNENSTFSKSVNQLTVLSTSKKHSLTQKNTESYKNQGNDEISMSLCEQKTQCETSQLNQSSNILCNVSAKKNYVCGLCSKEVGRKSDLAGHLRTHTGEKPFVCKLCGKAFSLKGDLERHKRTHTGEKPFTCSFCRKAFSQRHNLNTHERIHTGKKPFVCSTCSKAFTQKGDFDSHNKIHSGEKQYACSVCCKTFARKSYLIVHERIHTGEKPYACSLCSKGFSSMSGLEMHEIGNCSEKPFVCSFCSKAFSHKSSLVGHERYHTCAQLYACFVCCKTFSWKSKLKLHERTHTGDNSNNVDINL